MTIAERRNLIKDKYEHGKSEKGQSEKEKSEKGQFCKGKISKMTILHRENEKGHF